MIFYKWNQFASNRAVFWQPSVWLGSCRPLLCSDLIYSRKCLSRSVFETGFWFLELFFNDSLFHGVAANYKEASLPFWFLQKIILNVQKQQQLQILWWLRFADRQERHTSELLERAVVFHLATKKWVVLCVYNTVQSSIRWAELSTKEVLIISKGHRCKWNSRCFNPKSKGSIIRNLGGCQRDYQSKHLCTQESPRIFKIAQNFHPELIYLRLFPPGSWDVTELDLDGLPHFRSKSKYNTQVTSFFLKNIGFVAS